MTNDKNAATVRRLVDEIWNKGNYALADEVLSPSYTNHDPTAGGLPDGVESFKQFASGYRTAFPDMRLTIEDMLSDGDKVVWRWNVRGTHTGLLLGIPATGKPVEISGTVITRFDKSGRVVEDWSQWNALGLFQQIGAVPNLV